MSSRLPVSRPQSSPDLLGTLQREVNRVFDQMFGGATTSALGGFAPSVEMQETSQGVVVTAELPGMDEKAVEVSLEGDMLTLSGEKQQEKTEEKAGLHLSERSYGSFRRTLRLPWAADPAQTVAKFDKGVLTVTLQRPADARPSVSRIPIGGGQPTAS
jgi:HSP20 family protein